MPKVSVVIPVYNTKETYFREAVESILAQTYGDFELLLIDNGSEPYIKAIVDSYSDNRIHYHRIEKNMRSAYARNVGIELAKGEYIAFMDSDDLSYPTRLEAQVECLDKHPEVGCLGTNVHITGAKGKPTEFTNLRQHEEIESFLVFSGCAFCQSSLMVRKSIFDKHNIRYREEWVPAEDYGICVDMIHKTKFRILDTPLVKYRVYEGSTSHSHYHQQEAKKNIIMQHAINQYCGAEYGKMPLLSRFVWGEALQKHELAELCNILKSMVDSLCNHGISRKAVMYALTKRMKKNYYHTRTIKGQWELMLSPLSQFFKLPIHWRIICLLTKGVLS